MPKKFPPTFKRDVVRVALRGDLTRREETSVPGPGSRTVWAAVAVLAIGAGALSLVATRDGISATTDSTYYVSGARHLADGKGYTDFGGKAITGYAPGMSMLLASGALTGVDPVEGARVLNAVSFGALVVLGFVLGRRHLRESTALWVAAVITVSMPLLEVYSTLWSEPVFCVLVVAYVLSLESATSAPSMARLCTTGLLAGIAFFVRYPGMVLVPIGVIVLAATGRCDGRRVLLTRVGLFGAMSAAIPVAVVVRNLSADNTVFAERSHSTATARSILHNGFMTVRGWAVAGASLPAAFATVALLMVISLVLFGAVRARPAKTSKCLPLLVFVGGYIVFLVASEVATKIDPISTRLLSPIYAPTLVLVAVALEALAQTSARWIAAVVAISAGIWLLGAAAKSVSHLRAHPTGFAAQWVSDDFIDAVRGLPRGAVIYSNEGDGLYYTIGREPINLGPAMSDNLHKGDYFVWHTPNKRDSLSPAELRHLGVELEPISRLVDGTIYRVAFRR
jgi:hypothetical protein